MGTEGSDRALIQLHLACSPRVFCAEAERGRCSLEGPGLAPKPLLAKELLLSGLHTSYFTMLMTTNTHNPPTLSSRKCFEKFWPQNFPWK